MMIGLEAFFHFRFFSILYEYYENNNSMFQDSSHFYLLVSSKTSNRNNVHWQIKRVVSSTGPVGTALSEACRSSYSVPGQTEVLWVGSTGWEHHTSYRFNIQHLPDQGLIRLKLYEGENLIEDSGDIIDNGAESLRGGRLGVYCDSQEGITWSALSYRCL